VPTSIDTRVTNHGDRLHAPDVVAVADASALDEWETPKLSVMGSLRSLLASASECHRDRRNWFSYAAIVGDAAAS
jgi:hypothetical protein